MRLCTNCALFGGHKNHDVRMEEDVVREITIRAECLLEIFTLISENEHSFQNQVHILNNK
jgi:hypothetical protein